MKNKVNLLGLNLDNLSVEELKEQIIDFATSKESRTIMYVNPYSVNLSQKEAKIREILNFADILHPDGWGVVLACRLLGMALKERIVVTDFFEDFCAQLAKRGITLFF